MWHLLLTAALACQPVQTPAPDASARKPDAAAVKSAVGELRAAFERGQAPERAAAIERAVELVDPAVIEWVAKGLKDADPKVQTAAIEALRRMRHADALAALLACLERDKKLAKDAELSAKLVKAVGQHQSAAAVEKLAAAGLEGEPAVVDARLLAIANVRSVRSLELLIELLRGSSPERVDPRLGTFRLALMRLSGEDRGLSREAWLEWWNQNKKSVAVSAKPAPLPKELQLRWDYYWGNEVDLGRGKKRGERGNDPEGGK